LHNGFMLFENLSVLQKFYIVLYMNLILKNFLLNLVPFAHFFIQKNTHL
jgi:hypothetical protein